MAHTPALDLTNHSVAEVDALLGAAVRQMLAQRGIAILALAPESGVLSFLHPSLLDTVSEEALVGALLDVWDEDTVVAFLAQWERQRG